jgi:hypothetical protein
MKLRNMMVLLLFLSAIRVFSVDFGLILNEKFEVKDNDGVVPVWTQTATPWLSINPNTELSFYRSLDLSLEYTDTTNIKSSGDLDEWRPLFQVSRFQALWKPAPAVFVEAGRVLYADPLGYIAVGLFDGLKASLGRGQNTFNFSALYSGLQHKERAKIVMTQGDLEDYSDKDNYFSSKRLLFSAFWQGRQLGNFDNTVDFGGLVQTDVRSDDEERLHSQYLLGKFTLPLFSVATLSTGGILGIKEQDTGSAVSLAGDISGAVGVPGRLADRLGAGVYVSSGISGRTLRPYFPVTAIAGGDVYTPSLAGLGLAKVEYQVKPLESLYLNMAFRYFWRTTRDIIPGIAGTSESESNSLGTEFYASGIWTPVTDLSFSLGGGAFFPDGPIKDVDMPVMWKLTVALALSL